MPHQLGNDILLGQIAGRNEHLALPRDARDKHLYVCGGTGAGKSKFLEYLIRQDIAQWPKSRCGLMLLDYHGAVCDGLLAWLAKNNLNRPIISIDLRRDDWVLSYNLLRQRKKANASVVTENFVQAMAFVWGQEGTDQMPRFSRWAGNTIRALYDKGHTLAEAGFLIDRQGGAIRQALTSGLTDQYVTQDWAHANSLTPEKFEAQIESTINRLSRFVRSDYLRPVFGQTENSLDLGEALEEGAIILVSLAREGGRVSAEDARLFATLLLNDLWTAAQERGKRKGLKPFYVYLDEFQHFVSPTISENLDEARGFGLHMTMANQFPGQLMDRGEHGQRLFHSVMENATTKVVFRLTDSQNLKPMAEWLFRGTMNPDAIKHELYSTKVMGYNEETRVTRSEGRTQSRGGTSHSGESASRTESGIEDSDEIEAWNESEGTSAAETNSWSESATESTSETQVLVPVMGQELSHVQFRSLDEQLFQAMAALSDQAQRHCVARIGDRMRAPVSLQVPTVSESSIQPAWVERYCCKQFERWPFFLRRVEALKRLKERQQLLVEQVLQGPVIGEPITARRRIK